MPASGEVEKCVHTALTLDQNVSSSTPDPKAYGQYRDLLILVRAEHHQFMMLHCLRPHRREKVGPTYPVAEV